MESSETITENAQNIEGQKTTHSDDHKHDYLKRRRTLVVVGALLTLLGWALMVLLPWTSLSLSVLGLIASAIGVRIPPGPRRNLAITAIIASSVLILVYLIFIIVLNVLV